MSRYFFDHRNYSKEAKENGLIDPLIEQIIKEGAHNDLKISDRNYMSAINRLIAYMSLETGLNSEMIGYETNTRENRILNFYCNLERVAQLNEKMQKSWFFLECDMKSPVYAASNEHYVCYQYGGVKEIKERFIQNVSDKIAELSESIIPFKFYLENVKVLEFDPNGNKVERADIATILIEKS